MATKGLYYRMSVTDWYFAGFRFHRVGVAWALTFLGRGMYGLGWRIGFGRLR